MGVDHIRGGARCEKPTYVRCINTVERDDLGRRLTHKTRQPDLSLGLSDCLRKRRCRNRDTGGRLSCASEKHDHSTVVPIKRNERSGIEGDPRH